ncbi:MAG: DUF4129 domain-containing protein [Thermoplasmata archaeon]
MVAAWRASPVLLCLLAIALATGAAASLVTSAATPLNTGVEAIAPYRFSSTLLGVLMLLPFCLGLGALLYQRLRGGGILRIPPGMLAMAVSILLLMAAFAVLGPYLSPGSSLLGPGSTTHTPPPTNNSTGTTPPGNGGGGGIVSGFLPFKLPSWVPFLTAAVLALALAGLILPATWAAVADRRSLRGGRAGPGAARAEAQKALARAASELSEGTDPRAVIEHLYARLLERLAKVAGDLSGRTPEEIRAELLVPLGVRPAAAISLTRLFEESRYSTHPLGREDADRVRSAIDAAAADLARTSYAQ